MGSRHRTAPRHLRSFLSESMPINTTWGAAAVTGAESSRLCGSPSAASEARIVIAPMATGTRHARSILGAAFQANATIASEKSAATI